MNSLLKIETVWKKTSAGLLDTAMGSRAVRRWALKRGDRQLFDEFVVRNVERLPRRVRELRYLALSNLLHSFERAMSDGRISARVRRALIQTFIGNMVMGETARVEPFVKRHGFGPPTFLTISPTQRCNLCCKGCYAVSSSAEQATLRYDVFNRIIREKREDWGSPFTVITGGEPMMYKDSGKDLFDILEANRDSYFMMYTNATLIDDEAARRMADLGNVSPAISVEGWEKETDARRGAGVFRRTQEAMDRLAAHGVPFGISATVTRENAETVMSDKLIDHYFGNKGAVYGWIFQYMPVGRGFTVDLMITPEQRRWMLEKELDLVYRKRLFIMDFWNGGPMSVGCMAGGRTGGYFYIEGHGNISPCAFFPYYIDNIYKVYEEGRNLTSVIESGYFKALREWQDNYARGVKDPSEMQNLFRPCPIRDHHRIAYDIISRFQAKPLDGEAEKAIADDDYHSRMFEYDARLAEILDPFWDKGFRSDEPGLEANGRALVK